MTPFVFVMFIRRSVSFGNNRNESESSNLQQS
jgi:hypothetical protein